MNDDELTEWLELRWRSILANTNTEEDPDVDRFVNSTTVSIRYAFVTQLLGKFAQPDRDILCLQMGSQEEVADTGRWDPRSFCSDVVVPWVQRNQNVLGRSTDPYVNNPLRRPRLDVNMGSLRSRAHWEALNEILSDADNDTAVSELLDRCLHSVARRLAKQTVVYPVPLRISLDQLTTLLNRYLSAPSGGTRQQIVSTALLRTLGTAFSIFSRVEAQGVNEPDAASGAPGDVLCYGFDDSLTLAVEVKGNRLRLVELESTIIKARASGVANVLFATPGFAPNDQDAIKSRVSEEWVQGSNLYQIPIQELARNSFMLLSEEWRVTLLREICTELDHRATQPSDRIEWADLLTG